MRYISILYSPVLAHTNGLATTSFKASISLIMSLSETFKTKFKEAIDNNLDPCWRCSNFQHGTKLCTTDFTKCYEKGRVRAILLVNDGGDVVKNFEELRDLAEAYWQEVTKKGGSDPQGSGSGFSDRTPILDDMIGTDIYKRNKAQPGPYPDVPRNGVCQMDTEHVGRQPGPKDPMVISNYVQVTQVPSELSVYSVSFWRPNADPEKSPLVYNKRREIRRAFETLIDEDILQLKANKLAWATDFKDLWTHQPLFDHDQEDRNFGPFDYKQLNGKLVHDLYATVRYTGTLAGIDEALATADIAQLSDHVRALNAHVAQSVREHSREQNKGIIQLGANKFYVGDGFKEMTQKTRSGNIRALGLRTVRGYFTSIRPAETGTLLNINTATGAFISPMLVSELLAVIDDQDYVEKILRGATVRITYHRINFVQTQDQDIDYNGELERSKIFTQFGAPANMQKFYKIKEAKRKDLNSTRETDPNDKGTTVLNFFQNSKLHDRSEVTARHTNIRVDVRIQNGLKNDSPRNDLLCVNVGNRVKAVRSDSPTEEQMRQQTLAGAQWIPACCLEIIPNQQTAAPLSPDHTTKMLEDAVRLPAENAGLIDVEGLKTLGLRSSGPTNAQRTFVCCSSALRLCSMLTFSGEFGT